MMHSDNDDAEYIGYDLCGYPFNKFFPPNEQRLGSRYGGYPSEVAEVFFYDYMVQYYGVVFSFNGKNYVIPEGDNCTLINLSDKTKTEFESRLALVKEATVDGEALLTLINEDRLDDVDVQ